MNAQEQREYTATLLRFLEESEVKNPMEMQDLLAKLRRYEIILNRISTHECNGDISEREKTQETRTENKVKTIAAQLGFKVDFNGDCRGATIKFYLPSKRANSWDGESWCIFW
jgi:hypothetical protein